MKTYVYLCAPCCPLPPCATTLTVHIFVWQIADEEEEKGADRLLFTFLTLISKLCKHCSMLELGKPHDALCKIWGKEITRMHKHMPAKDDMNKQSVSIKALMAMKILLFSCSQVLTAYLNV